MKKFTFLKTLLVAVCLLGGVSSAWAANYKPTSDEVIILNDVYNAEATSTGYSNHTAISWAGTVSFSDKKCGDPSNAGAATSTNVKACSVKGNGKGKNLDVKFTGVTGIIIYHESHSSRYIQVKNGDVVVQNGSVSTYYTEVTDLNKNTEYTLRVKGTGSGTDDQDLYVYAVKLIAALSVPTINTQPVSASYVLNDAATALSVAATASSGDLSYQWYSNTSETTEGATALTGEISNTYTPSTAASGTTYYYCAVTDDNATTNSNFAAITVGSAYTVTTSVNNVAYGTVTATNTYIGGTNAVITATPNSGYKFVSWTVNGTENASTTNPHTFSSIAADHTIQAVFEALKTVSFSVSNTNNGTRTDNFATEYADGSDEFTAPTNHYLSSDNQTLTGWNDGTTTYAVGATIDCSAGSKTLTPVFTTNSGASFAATLDARTAGFNITWIMGNSSGALFNINQKTGYYVKQATINGASVDIPMYVNADGTDNQKLYNIGDGRENTAQFNDKTILTIPVVNGSVITVVSGNDPFKNEGKTATTINGVDTYTLTNSDMTATYTYSGETGTIDIQAGTDIRYITSVAVTYPSPYSVTYDGNGATSGSTTDAATYDKNASVTAKTNSFTKTGYAFTGWNTEADGTGTAVAAGAKFTITGNTTLYAQWMKGDGATITWTLSPLNSESAELTSSQTSTSSYLNNLGTINHSLVGLASSPSKAANRTAKINRLAEKDNDKYIYVTFDVEEGYIFTPTSVAIKVANVSNVTTFDAELVSSNSISVSETGKTFATTDGSVEDWNIANNDKSKQMTGSVTLKIYAYAATAGTFRFGSTISITGVVAANAEEVTVSSAGFATYVPSKDLDFTDTDIKAYKVKVSTKGKATLTQVDNVPASTPVLLYKDGGATEDIPVMTDAAEVTDNDLVAGTGAAVATIDGDYTNMILNNGENGIGFYLANSQTVAANRAYLHIATSLAPAAGARMVMVFADEETTGIKNLNADQSLNNKVYDLQGRHVAQPAKGLYIVNGRKVIIK